MTPATQAVFDAAKATRDGFAGVEGTHLSQAERRELVAAGLVIERNGREQHRISVRYPARMREADLRAIVNAKVTARRLGQTP